MWAYRSITIPINVFDFTVSRHRDGPANFLQGFTGTLMADCYAGYEVIHAETGGLFTRAACVAHARRKVLEATDNHPIHTSRLLVWFKQLYDIEDRGKELSPADRQVLRDAEARPLWTQIAEYVESPAVANVLPNEQFGKALGYLRNHHDQFVVYLDDGLVPIDNNDTEQLMKQVALGRKNWLVIGSVPAGYRAADLMTLVSSAVRNDLDVASYLKDILDRLLAGDTDFHSMRQGHLEAIAPRGGARLPPRGTPRSRRCQTVPTCPPTAGRQGGKGGSAEPHLRPFSQSEPHGPGAGTPTP